MITLDIPVIASIVLIVLAVGGLVMAILDHDNDGAIFQVFRLALAIVVSMRVFGVW